MVTLVIPDIMTGKHLDDCSTASFTRSPSNRPGSNSFEDKIHGVIGEHTYTKSMTVL